MIQTPSLALLAFGPLMVALGLRLSPSLRLPPWLGWKVWMGLSLALAWAFGILNVLGVLMVLLPLGLALWRERMTSEVWRHGLEALIVLLALALAFHMLPGIRNPLVLSGALGPSAASYRLFWNFDKGMAALAILGLVSIQPRPSRFRNLAWMALALVGTMILAWGLGLTRPELKWGFWFLLWAPAVLLLVALPEEALFRLWFQERLERVLGPGREGWIVMGSALAFGLVHAAGGWRYIASAALAGLGYGFAYRFQRNPWHPVLAHFALNALHVLAFVYPWVK
jgi:membrane protease YdiL (CAAX protease family)